MDVRTLQLVTVGAAAVAVAAIAYKLTSEAKAVAGAVIDTAGGIVSGNNAVTQNQTNAAGEKTTAYEGAGVLGTIGAATNSASGGMFASWGESLGGWVYDATHGSVDWSEAQPVKNTGSVSGSW